MKAVRPISERLLWSTLVIVVAVVMTTGVLTNITLRSVERSLPSRLLRELNDQSLVLERLSGVIAATKIAEETPSTDHLEALRTEVEMAYEDIVRLRESYVFDNLINSSAFHAVIAPAVADLRIWLSEGVSGYGPQTDCLITFQEFSSGWNIEKEVLYLKISSWGCLNWLLQFNAGSDDANMGAQFLTWSTGF